MTNKWISIFKKFEKTKILVIGDAMIDYYMWGNIHRKSPEADIPVVDIEKYEKKLGGAANVANNIKSLGGNVILSSVIGNNDQGLLNLMRKENLCTHGILQEERKTSVKTRIICDGKHQLRLDEEDTFPIKNEKYFIQHSVQLMSETDVIVFQDYNKGLLSKKVITELIKEAKFRNKPILVDPKKDNYWMYKGVDLFKPNKKELLQSQSFKSKNIDLKKIFHIASNQRKKIDAKAFLLTLSEKGVFIQTKNDSMHYPSFKKKIIDVSGAGDAVIATSALALACQLDFFQLAQLANLAGGLSCESIGVNPLKKNDFLKEVIRSI